jgi:hypothetical protein
MSRRSSLLVYTGGIVDAGGDTVYNKLESRIASWTVRRDTLAAQIKALLEAAEFHGQPVNEFHAWELISQGQVLLFEAQVCGFDPPACSW